MGDTIYLQRFANYVHFTEYYFAQVFNKNLRCSQNQTFLKYPYLLQGYQVL